MLANGNRSAGSKVEKGRRLEVDVVEGRAMGRLRHWSGSECAGMSGVGVCVQNQVSAEEAAESRKWALWFVPPDRRPTLTATANHNLHVVRPLQRPSAVHRRPISLTTAWYRKPAKRNPHSLAPPSFAALQGVSRLAIVRHAENPRCWKSSHGREPRRHARSTHQGS